MVKNDDDFFTLFTLLRPKMLNVLMWRHDDVIGAIVINSSYKVCLFVSYQSNIIKQALSFFHFFFFSLQGKIIVFQNIGGWQSCSIHSNQEIECFGWWKKDRYSFKTSTLVFLLRKHARKDFFWLFSSLLALITTCSQINFSTFF